MLALDTTQSTLSWRTNEGVETLRLVVPVDSQEIDWDTSQHDGQADATHHRLRVKGEDEQEGPEDEVNDGPNQADLQDRRKKKQTLSSLIWTKLDMTHRAETKKTLYIPWLVGACWAV